MWLFRTLLLVTVISACGFTPVYRAGGPAAKLQGDVLVDAPQTRSAFILVEHLEERLGRGTAARYGLSVDMSFEEEGLAISGSNNVTRFNLLGEARFDLRQLETDETVLSDTVSSFASYSASAQPVATLAAERDAKDRLIRTLADQIVAQLILRVDAP